MSSPETGHSLSLWQRIFQHFRRRSSDGPALRFRWFVLSSVFLVVLAVAISPFDVTICNGLRLSKLPGDLRRTLQLSEAFAHSLTVGAIAWATWSLAPHLRRMLVRVLMCAFWPPLIVHLIKFIVRRRRPMGYVIPGNDDQLPVDIVGTWHGISPWGHWNVAYPEQSFPSAHVALAVGLAIGLCWMLPRARWLFITLAVLASLQRVSAWAHWPSDVLAAAAIALLVSGGLVQNWGLGWLMGNFERKSGVSEPSSI